MQSTVGGVPTLVGSRKWSEMRKRWVKAKTYWVWNNIASICPKCGDYGSSHEDEKTQILDYGRSGNDNAILSNNWLIFVLGTMLSCGGGV